jgi:D-serine deaminase-like pyridoxal phosphate-dependent protein
LRPRYPGRIVNIADLPTPSFVIDTKRLAANTSRMIRRAEALGVPLRPHGKTLKCVSLVRELFGEASGLCTSTLLEAEHYFAGGVRDLFHAVALTPAKAPRAAALIAAGADLKCLIDDPDGVGDIAAVATDAGVSIPLIIEIAVDGYRSGVSLQSNHLETLAAAIKAHAGVQLEGVMSYGGASYSCTAQQASDLAERHRSTLVAAADRLRLAEHSVATISFGSTPAILHAKTMEGMTELRCGIFALQDLFQAAIGACEITDIAGSVLTEVIGRQPHNNRIVIDAGGLALSKDRSTASTANDAGFGLVCDGVSGHLIEDVYVQATSQELGLVTTRSGRALNIDDYPVGRRLRVLPNHADMTAAAYDRYYLLDSDGGFQRSVERFNGW